MSVSLQVLYPVTENSKFDFDYYLDKHMSIVGDSIGEYIKGTLVAKGLAGGADTPAGFHAIATIVFDDQSALDSAMSNMGAVLSDIPNFTDSEPVVLIGEVVS